MRVNSIQLLRVCRVGVIFIHLPFYAARDFGVPDLLAGVGWVGNRIAFPVPLFFVVSGFVLTHALQTTPSARFLFARFLRLYPGYWLAAAAAVGLAWFSYWPAENSWRDRLVWLTHVNGSLTPPAGRTEGSTR